jgi:hypothetical protein
MSAGKDKGLPRFDSPTRELKEAVKTVNFVSAIRLKVDPAKVDRRSPKYEPQC